MAPKVKTSHIAFVQIPHADEWKRKTKVWYVTSKRDALKLGNVGWWGRWRRYVFSPHIQTLFDADCLREIADFCESQTEEHLSRCKEIRDEERQAKSRDQ